jgi:Carboxypeptidase regulatory-like domain
VVWFAFASAGWSQNEQGGITGTVQDAQGRPIPAASVLVQQKETKLLRSTRTNSSGVYFVDGLPIGTYSAVISCAGFAEARVPGIRLSIGQTRTLDVTLPLAGQISQVSVVARLSELDQESAAVGDRIEQRQIGSLPLNGRNWASLLPLIAGAVDPGTSDQRSVRFAGHGRDDNNFTLDGVDAGGISNQPQKTAVRLAIPTSAVSEFQVDSSLFTAETGIGTGAQIVLASPAGTNEYHGNLFEFLRNDVLDARNPFAAGKQPFRLNQFGADFGGPIVKNRTFLFAAFEGLRQRLDQALQGFVPSASYRSMVLAQSPVLAPLIAAFPTVGAVAQPNDPTTDLFAGLSPQRADETSGMVRFDHRFTERTTAFLRVNADESVADVPLGNLRDRTVTDTRPLNGVFALTRVLSPTALNETRLGFNQVFSRTSNITPLPYTLRVTGFTAINSARTREEDDTSAALIDSLSLTHGRHTVKMGIEVRRILTDPASSADGTLTFTSRDNFAANVLDSASVTATLPLKRLRKTQVFAFLQDEYKAASNLTVNLGVRYSFFNVFHEVDGRAVPFDFASCGGFCQPGAEFSDPRTLDIDPRVGVAWAPKRFGGRTVIRTGFGIYHGDGQLEDQNLPASNDVPRYALNSRQINGLDYPIDPFLAPAPGILSPRAQNRNRKDEYASEWGISVQQALPLHFTGTVSYMGNKGTDLQTITYANVPDPITGIAPYPQFGQVEYRTNDSNSTFHALQLSVHRVFRSGWLLGGNYMWSHAINDGSLGGGETDATTPENVFCRTCERASSSFDIRHFFTASSVYELPFGMGKAFLSKPGALRAMLGGWTLSSIGTARSGRPVNITISRAASGVPGGYNLTQRPDLMPGVSLTPPGGSTPAQWINPAAFRVPAPGTWGNAGRNLARGPSLYQLDLGVSKRVTLGERAAVVIRGEAFNVFNRAQYSEPIGDITVLSQFGLIQSTVNTTPIGTGTPRQIQFMLRLEF